MVLMSERINFRPTRLKGVCTLLVSVALSIWVYVETFVYDCPSCIEPAKREAAVQAFIISFAVVYLVWSLVQKRGPNNLESPETKR